MPTITLVDDDDRNILTSVSIMLEGERFSVQTYKDGQSAYDVFCNNSGLGLAISKQVVEAHDGVVWADNIRPTLADPASEPLGACCVVGLPF